MSSSTVPAVAAVESPETVTVAGIVLTRGKPIRPGGPCLWNGRAPGARFSVFIHEPWPDATAGTRSSYWSGSVGVWNSGDGTLSYVLEVERFGSLTAVVMELEIRIAAARRAFGPRPRRRGGR